ncbi:hypothetical protein OsJ_09423 [Oryza sativa Japonica Group]|uniref:RING-type E3 ubiquitin transferase n=1 Tax=Oryza sativa subsp. japonica TaxID=39947 RepID=A3AE58_ORYSJ|nr:hypothetical protein OsJ_09423 [Oryza sativa Japonica Group]
MDAPPAFRSSSPSSSNASVPMVVITVVGILAAFALLASYYAFVTKCQALRGLWSRGAMPWRGHGGGGARRRAAREASVIRTVATEERGLGMPFIRMLPVGSTRAGLAHRGGAAAAPPATKRTPQRRRKPESVGDEAIDTRKKYDEEFAVQPMRRSLSMDDSCHKQLYVSVQEFLTQQRQV